MHSEKYFRFDVYLIISEIMKSLLKHSGDFSRMFSDLIKFSFLSLNNSRIILELEEFKKIRRAEKFDLIIFESLVSESMLGLGQEFNIPMITISSMPPAKPMHDIVGNFLHPSFVVSQMSAKTKLNNFWDRLENFMLMGMEILFYQYFEYHNNKIYE